MKVAETIEEYHKNYNQCIDLYLQYLRLLTDPSAVFVKKIKFNDMLYGFNEHLLDKI